MEDMGGAKKESFDDFFESLMKGQGSTQKSSSSPSATSGVNLDAILSSLNQPSASEKVDQVDSRFESLLKQRSVGESNSSVSEAMRQHNAQISTFDDDTDFVEFMKALKKDYQPSGATKKPSKGFDVKLPPVIPQYDVEVPEIVPDVSKMSKEQVKAHFMKELIRRNPELEGLDKWTGPAMTRSQQEAEMSKTAPGEKRQLNEALEGIYKDRELPPYMTGIRVPNPDTGEHTYIDLLQSYGDGEMVDSVSKIMERDAEAAGMSRAEWEDELDEITDEEMKRLGERNSEAENDLMTHSVVTKLFETLSDHGKLIEDMQYWSLFPKDVKRWVLYTRSPKGYYNDQGEWETVPEQDISQLVDTEALGPNFDPSILNKPITKQELDQMAAAYPSLRGTDDGSPRTVESEDEFSRIANSEWAYWEGVYENEQQYLPADLRGQYRFHIRPDEMAGMHPRLRRHFSFKFASEGEIIKFRSAQAIEKWGQHPGDSGNSAVQIAILTLRINHLTKVLRTHSGDTHNAYRLTELIRRRRGLMKHLKKRNLMTYYSLLKDIKLRDQVELWTAARK